MSERTTVVGGKPSGLEETEVDGLPRVHAQPAQTIGRFVVESTLGAGGMGLVLLAHDPTLDRRVAIKLLREDDGSNSAGRVRMMREAQAMARLRHPHVVDVYEAGIQDANVYLVMEYVDGGTLRRKLPALDHAGILRVFVEAGRGLAAAHRAGLVHRDFKPDNVLIDEHGHAKVTDFGLAARDDSIEERRTSNTELDALSHTLTRTGDIMGTPRYMAPEQHLGGTTDARTDQFSFCVALYEALFERHPFRADTRDSLLASVVHERPRAPEPRGVSARVRNAIMRGLAREPDGRFPDMDALLVELAPRNRRMLFSAIGIGALALGLAVFALTRTTPDPIGDARRIALETDSEMLEVQLPAGSTVEAIRTVGGAPTPATWLPTGQLAVPRGPHVIDYRDASGSYAFAVISRGGANTRTLVLPPPERLDGYRFIPGGEVEIGDRDNAPVATIQLAPYLIAERADAALSTYDEALKVAFERHARLPTAGEWEWAARLVPMVARDHWQWTASQFAPYPYAADDRDDPFVAAERTEVRGGGAGPATRRAGSRLGKAEVRLARTSRSVPVQDAVTIELTDEKVPSVPGIVKLRSTLSPREHARLARFVVGWIQRADRPPLLLEGGTCALTAQLRQFGIPLTRLDEKPSDKVTLRVHPDRAFRRERVIVCDSETEVFDLICFDGDRIHPGSTPILDSIASTLKANAGLQVEIQAYVGKVSNPRALSQRRAEVVRDRLVSAGIASSRLHPRGRGTPNEADARERALFGEPPARAPDGCTLEPGERVAFEILKR